MKIINCATELEEQITLKNWADLTTIPGTNKKIGEFLIVSANGGSRSRKLVINKKTGVVRWVSFEGNRLKKSGVSSGVPDIFLAYPSNNYPGLFIEMKKKQGGVVSKNQLEWLKKLQSVGYPVAVAKGCESAIQTIKNYLAGNL